MSKPVRIAVVMACFNRKQTTLRCLETLFAQETADIALDVHLLDDASPDGTGQAVKTAYPQVHVIEGDGERFWGGGMYLAMQSATRTEYDFMLWLNDDVALHADALETLLAAHDLACAEHGEGPHIIVGAVTDPETGEFSYSGFRRRNHWHPAQVDRITPRADDLTACDTMNGNCVLVPAAVVRDIGLIDPTYVHQLGDIDYGYRASRAGARIWIGPVAVGRCSVDNRIRQRPWQDRSLSFAARWRSLNSPLGTPLRPWFRFMWTYAGAVGLLLLAAAYVKALLVQVPKPSPLDQERVIQDLTAKRETGKA